MGELGFAAAWRINEFFERLPRREMERIEIFVVVTIRPSVVSCLRCLVALDGLASAFDMGAAETAPASAGTPAIGASAKQATSARREG
jgi:hypothetical protein